MVSRGSLLHGGSTRSCTFMAAVEADSAHTRVAADHGLVVRIVNHGHVDVVHVAVVEEMATAPITACVAQARVSETVVNAAVETYPRAPVACVPDIDITSPAPVTRSP